MYSGSSSPDAQEQRFFSAMSRLYPTPPAASPLSDAWSGSAFGAHGELRAQLLTHDELLHFAGDGQWELGHEPYVAWDFVLGDLAAAELADLLVGRRRAGSELYPGADLFALLLVGHAEYLHGLYFRVPVQELFDLAGEDIFTATDQHVLQTPGDVAITLRIEH